MYYRVAIQADPSARWQWKSTVLSSLNTVIQFLRLYRGLPPDSLRVFSSSSRDELNEQLARENEGRQFTSVTAAHFLQERLIRLSEVTQAEPASGGGACQQRVSLAVATTASMNESRREGNSLAGRGMSALERRRHELESGPGGDHNIPYTFTLPASMPQVLTWMRLLARMRRGELQP